MKLSDFDYDLPEHLIAQTPAQKREGSRLLVLNRKSGKIEHKKFTDIVDYISKEDLLVLNNTKVIPARLYGAKYGSGAKIEVLLDRSVGPDLWEVLVKPAKRLDIGNVIEFAPGFYAEVKDKYDEKALLFFASVAGFENDIKKFGLVPLPPYIKNENPNEYRERYQTVYASKVGATAAPTAGLHFTDELLASINAKKIYVTLHTGYGTFAPVRQDDIKKHKMHKESYELSVESINEIKSTKENGGRVIAVGTTSTRLLESVDDAGSGETDIFIYPGHKFSKVDAMITNFHLPKSTLMMLISAFAGTDLIKKAYKEAVKEKYRFFSFGDAMLII